MGENRFTGVVDFFGASNAGCQELLRNLPDRNESYRWQLKNFIECMELYKISLVTTSDELKVLQIVGAARYSVSQNLGIFLPVN